MACRSDARARHDGVVTAPSPRVRWACDRVVNSPVARTEDEDDDRTGPRVIPPAVAGRPEHWIVLGLASVGLALLVWLCWGSRRALGKCLVLSLSAHLVLVLYGSTVPAVQLAVSGERSESSDRSHIRRIQVSPMVESAKPSAEGTSRAREGGTTPSAGGSLSSSRLELAAAPLRLADVALSAPRPEFADRAALDPPINPPAPMPIGTATPRPSLPVPEPPRSIRVLRRIRLRRFDPALRLRFLPTCWPKWTGNRQPRRRRRARRRAIVVVWSRRPWEIET